VVVKQRIAVNLMPFLILVLCAVTHAYANDDTKLILNPQITAQTIEGFGASGAWWAQHVGGWPDAERRRIVELLFSADDGIGLSIYRYNIGAGSGDEIRDPWRRTETFEVQPGQYDWSRDGNAVRILKEICEQGVRHIVLFANSPPGRMTKSGLAFGAVGAITSNLREDMYDAYATYLVDIARHFIVNERIPVHGISPINEPQWPWNEPNQEGCHYTPRKAARLVEILLRKIEEVSLDVRVEAVESGDWKRSRYYVEALFKNPYISKNMDTFALHSYWSGPDDKKAFARYFRRKYPNKKLLMTEWCEMKGGRALGIDSALTMANEIVDDLVEGGVSSWQHWIAVSKYNFRDGLVFVNEKEKSILPAKRLWAMGNFSRFIRPGFQRYEASTNSPTLRALGCRSPDSDRIIGVVLNNSATPETAKLVFQEGARKFKMLAFETSEVNDLKQVYSGAVETHYTFPPKSITTLVFR